MQFTLSSGTLNSRLQNLARVINSKNTLNILDCFLFEVVNNQLTITASDNENVMQSTITLDSCNGNGRFALPNKTILNAVRELPEQPLSFNVNETDYNIEITYQNGKYNFTGQAAEEYPITQGIEEEASSITLDSSLLVENISRSLFATSQDEIRPVMSGIYFDINNNGLTIVATDGHKLVRNHLLNVNTENATGSFILPPKPAQLLKSVLTRDEGETVIRFTSRGAEMTFAEGKLLCRLIEGRYPNYASVIPAGNPNVISIDRKSLMGALKRVLPFASESSHLIRFHLMPESLEVSSEDIDFATSAKENIMCEYSGTSMDIGFKGSTVYEILNNLSSEEVTIQLADPSRAGLIVPTTQPENQDILMLIMPMLLND